MRHYIEKGLQFLREERDKVEGFGDQFGLFFCLLLLLFCFGASVVLISMVIYFVPEVFVPLIIGVFVLWKVYQHF